MTAALAPIPRQAPAMAAAPRSTSSEAVPLSASALVIDGHEPSRALLVSQLRELGLRPVRQATRLAEARALLEDQTFDLVLCDDRREPGAASGQDLLDELRREQLLPMSTVVIMLTAEATYAKVMEAGEASLDGVLVKPFPAAALVERLAEARRRRQALAPIFEAIAAGDLAGAADACLARYEAGQPYGLMCARMALELLLRQHDHARALALCGSLLERGALPWARLGQARSLVQAGDQAGARRLLTALLADHGDDADAHDLLARVQLDLGELQLAHEAFRAANRLTPACLLRLQHAGTLAHHVGLPQEARQLLERTLAVGMQSKLFDVLTLALVALLRHDAADLRGLAEADRQIRQAAARLPKSQRLKRFAAVSGALVSLSQQRPAEALVAAQSLAEHGLAADFDAESAGLTLALWSRLPAGRRPAQAWRKLAQQLGERFCVSRAMCQTLEAFAPNDDMAHAVLRDALLRMQGLGEQAVAMAMGGQVQGAVEQLLAQGQASANGRLIELANGLVRRYGQLLGDAAAWQARVQELAVRFGQPAVPVAGIRRSLRAPGGMALRAR